MQTHKRNKQQTHTYTNINIQKNKNTKTQTFKHATMHTDKYSCIQKHNKHAIIQTHRHATTTSIHKYKSTKPQNGKQIQQLTKAQQLQITCNNASIHACKHTNLLNYKNTKKTDIQECKHTRIRTHKHTTHTNMQEYANTRCTIMQYKTTIIQEYNRTRIHYNNTRIE